MPSLPSSYREIAMPGRPSPQPEFYENRRGEVHLRAWVYAVVDADDLTSLYTYLYSSTGCYYPHPPAGNGALVRRVRMIPRGAIGGTASLASYDEAIVEILYSTEGPRWVNGVFLDEIFDVAWFKVSPPKGLYWSDGTEITTAEASKGIPVMGVEHVLLVGQSTTYPTDIFTYVNTLNASTVTGYIFSAYSFSAGTVLYGSPTVRSHSDYVLGTKYSYQYRHIINPFGWNKFWNAATPAWETVYVDDGGATPYVQYMESW